MAGHTLFLQEVDQLVGRAQVGRDVLGDRLSARRWSSQDEEVTEVTDYHVWRRRLAVRSLYERCAIEESGWPSRRKAL